MKKNLQTAFQTRQYMLSMDYEIYYYCDRDMPTVSLHTHDFYEFYFFLEGTVSIEIDQTRCPLTFGDVIFIPPKITHRPVIHSHQLPYRRFVLWISDAYFSQILSLSPDYGYLSQYVKKHNTYLLHHDRYSFNTLQSLLLRMLEELHADHFGCRTQAALCLQNLILHINRMLYEQNHPKIKRTGLSLHQNVMNYIEDHIGEDLSLDRLAAVFFVSKYHIAHTFRENLGISVHQYVTKKRLALCREALLEHQNISESIDAFGFGDYSGFYRAFKKEYGISPKAFQDSLPKPERINRF
ncbi:MAG: AraC family transcriptional regulator [Lachnospiraceae bacterium]|nr:AraC family transcriptional regulator [Lachnospiraceae bacterium]